MATSARPWPLFQPEVAAPAADTAYNLCETHGPMKARANHG
jgi:hypothetical protein